MAALTFGLPAVFLSAILHQSSTGQTVGTADAPLGVLIAIGGGCSLIILAIDVLLLACKLEVHVRRDGIHARFVPLAKWRHIRFDELRGFARRRYDPIGEYGGWGVKGWKNNRALNISGSEGVQLVFHDGQRLLLGSLRADALEQAIARASGRQPGNIG